MWGTKSQDSVHRPQLLKRTDSRGWFEPRSLCLTALSLTARPTRLTSVEYPNAQLFITLSARQESGTDARGTPQGTCRRVLIDRTRSANQRVQTSHALFFDLRQLRIILFAFCHPWADCMARQNTLWWTSWVTRCFNVFVLFCFYAQSTSTLILGQCRSPWYNRNGWLGVKHQVTYEGNVVNQVRSLFVCL